MKTQSSGIIRLIVLPWYFDETTQTDSVPQMTIKNAVSEGQYVTIVIDNIPPNVPLDQSDRIIGARLNEPSSQEGDIHVYGTDTSIILTLDALVNITDNFGQGGIPASQAWGIPWTMDDANKLYWYVQIGEDTDEDKIPSGKLNVYNSFILNNVWSTSDITKLTNETGYRLYIKFEDSLGNISPEWIQTNYKVRYSTAARNQVTDLKAECNTVGNQITVSWVLPKDMSGARLYINDRLEATANRPERDPEDTEEPEDIPQSRTFSVPRINASNVREGEAVSNVMRYSIKVEAFSTVTADPVRLDIWNIPEMSLTAANPAILIEEEAHLRPTTSGGLIVLGTAGLNRSYVLTNSGIELNSHIPIGTNLAFQGKFYGNGHIVTIRNITSAAETGLFGYITNGMVRDLTVDYKSATETTISIIGSGYLGFGGIAGRKQNAQLINVLVKGDVNVTIDSGTLVAGGIIGTMTSSLSITNAYCDIKLEFTVAASPGTQSNIGGIVGSLRDANMEDCFFAGSINGTINSTSISYITIGGLIGFNDIYAPGHYYINNCAVRGNINITSNGHKYIGGVIGLSRIETPNETTKTITINNTSFIDGNITVNSNGNQTSSGGFLGLITRHHYIYNCGTMSGTLNVTSTIDHVSVGGFTSGFAGDIQNCYSKIDIITNSIGPTRVGGFIAQLEPAASINNCYATGNIRSVHNGNNGTDTNFSSFVGYCFGTIKNSYTLGNVFVDKQSGTGIVIAGGLVGNLVFHNNIVGNISNSFSTGYVFGQSASTVQVSASGLVGYFNLGGRISNSVALGARVIAATKTPVVGSAPARNVGRVAGLGPADLSNNYAINSMTVGTGEYIDGFADKLLDTSNSVQDLIDIITTAIPSAPVTSPIGATTINGADVTVVGPAETNIRSTSFWLNTLRFNLDGTGIGGIANIWDFSVIESRGHPILRGLSGQ
ncbi:MAG: hypothetical protein FWD13_12620 [Treponema sp.]|nr:hypothetical protein [Treponema sp.]